MKSSHLATATALSSTLLFLSASAWHLDQHRHARGEDSGAPDATTAGDTGAPDSSTATEAGRTPRRPPKVEGKTPAPTAA